MSKLKEKTERGENSHNPASTNLAPEGVVPQEEGAVFDFDCVGEEELVGFAVETGAGFGGWGGNVDQFKHFESAGDKQDNVIKSIEDREGREDIQNKCPLIRILLRKYYRTG